MSIGQSLDLAAKHNFIVEIDDFQLAGFKTCSELSAEVSEISYREGGRSIPHKSPGVQTFADVTLERGVVVGDSDFLVWLSQVAKLATGVGLTELEYKRNLDIVQFDRAGEPIFRHTLFGAWPVKFVAGAWDADSESDVVVESVTLAYDYFERTKG